MVILFSVIAGVLHFSVDMFTIFKVESDTLERILFVSDFVWFGCTLWATAQVYEEVIFVLKAWIMMYLRYRSLVCLISLTSRDVDHENWANFENAL